VARIAPRLGQIYSLGKIQMPTQKVKKLTTSKPMMPLIGYHVTAAEKLSSILAHGLVPDIGLHSENMGETTPAVYLFPSFEAIENALSNWLGEQLEDIEKVILLKVVIPADAVIQKDSAGFEIVILTPIPANNITVLTEDVDSYKFPVGP
jgi:hypothetical protein